MRILGPLAPMVRDDPSGAPDEEPALSWSSAKETLTDTLAGIWENFVGHVPFLVAGFLVLVTTAVAAYGIREVACRLLDRSRMRPSLRELLTRLAYLSVWLGGLLAAAMVVFPGLTPTKALGGLGLASVAIGFAFKDIFENFFAGILILWRFPFDRGDYVSCGSIMGRIEEITICNTLIRQPTDELVVVPNSKLFSEPVEVLTYGELRRVTMTCGVAYEADLDAACDAIERALEACGSVSADRPAQVFPRDFGASSVDIEVAWWTSPAPVDLRRSRAEVVRAIKLALEEARVEIPFPQRVLSFKTEACERAFSGEASGPAESPSPPTASRA